VDELEGEVVLEGEEVLEGEVVLEGEEVLVPFLLSGASGIAVAKFFSTVVMLV